MVQKKIYIILLVVFSLLAVFFTVKILKAKKKQGTVVTAVKLSLTKISAEKTFIDLGKIKKGGEAKAVFTLTNTGDNPLVISEIEPECHCTIADWEKGPVQPGKKTLITGTYDSERVGYFQNTLKVHLNTAEGLIILVIRGKVEDK